MCVSGVVLAQSSAPLPVTHVTLYTSGVGYFERTGTIDGDLSSTMYFPLEQVNDVLKSLVLLDFGGGTIEPVTYGAQDPLTKQLKAFSIDLSDDPSEAVILDRLRGAEVTVTYLGPNPAAPVTGTIVGVETKNVQLPGATPTTTTESMINVMTTDSLVSVPLSSVASVEITDPVLRQELKQALATVASGRDASKRPVTVNFVGKGKRKVYVGYLTQTPLWQTTYRLILGKKPFLQGWALVQNTGQEDWNNVSLSLVAGRPISFVQDLYSPVYVDRPIVQPQITGSPNPQLYASGLDIDHGLNTPPAETPFVGSLPTIDALHRPSSVTAFSVDGQVNGQTLEDKSDIPAAKVPPYGFGVPFFARNQVAGGKLGTSLFAYNIKVPVTVPRQQSAMIPFVGADIEADRVSIYNHDVQADHPLTGAKLKNTSGMHLMGGPITVFDDNAANGNGYVGDALIGDTEPNQTRLISFAVDLAVDGSMHNKGGNSIETTITINKGVLKQVTVSNSTTDYEFKNNSEESRTLIVEHPYSDENEKLIEPAAYSEKTADVYRFSLTVGPHAGKTLAVKIQQPISQTYAITDLSNNDIAVFVRGASLSAAGKEALQHVSTLRGLVADTEAKIANNEHQSSQLTNDQERIRKNMAALDKAMPLYKRYAAELDTQETKINNLTAQHDALETELSQRSADLSNYIANLTIN
jgi:hypothetical protein